MQGSASIQLAGLARQLETVAKTWKLETARELRSIANDAIPRVRQAARDRLPRAGGLNEDVAGQNITVSTLLSPGSAAVRVRHDTHKSAMQTERGYVRHPVFNRRGSDGKRIFVREEVPAAAGWWSQTFDGLGPAATARMLQFIREMSAAIEASAL